jgi:hypothetical protein
MRKPPFGFATLYEAVDAVGRAVLGVNWQHPPSRDVHERVTTIIAQGCEAGKIEAGYPNVHGTVDDLGRSEWQKPQWPNYFATGTIDLHDLPLLDDKWRPISDGRTVPVCTREIFIRKDSLEQFVASLAPPPVAPSRYPGDAALIEEGLILLAGGMTLRAAAEKLADDADGTSPTSTIDRLRTKLSAEQKRRKRPGI